MKLHPKMSQSSFRILFIVVFAILITSCGEPLSPADSLSTLASQEKISTPQEATATIAATETIITPTKTLTSTSVPTSTNSVTSYPSPTEAATLSPTPLPALLPAALYFISPDPEGIDQIWRLERDSKSLTQITRERLGVTGMDTRQIDGSLAFTSDNKLFLADHDGGNTQLLFEGPPKPDDWQLEETWLWTQAAANPRWSPDGTKIAISQNGVLIIEVETGESMKLVNNHIPPPHEIAQIMIYEPGSWSPDGEKILSKLRYYEGNSWIALPISGEPGGKTFAWGGYQVNWSQDSQHAYAAVPGVWAYSEPGLWRSDTSNAEKHHLTAELDAEFVVGWPIQVSDGRLYFFMGGGNGYAQVGRPLPLMMYASSANSLLDAQALRNERYSMKDAIWAPDAGFAIVLTQSGQLILMPNDQSPSVPLINLGHQTTREFRWGTPPAGDWELPPHPALNAEPTPIADCPETPPSELVIGDQARVTYTDGRRLRVRASAEITDSNIVRELIEGTRFVIVEGPECVTLPGPDQSYVFWQIFIPDYNITGWAAEGAIEGGQDVYYIERWP